MIYEKNGVFIYFSHIPRNGGRYVIKTLLKNSFKKTREPVGFVGNEETMHISYETAKKTYPEILSMKKIAIVRDPVSRFASICGSPWAIKTYFKTYDDFSKMSDKTYFNYIMKEKKVKWSSSNHIFDITGLKETPTNWFRPQKDFFDESFYVWKYENGLGNSFREFLKYKVDIDIDPKIYIPSVKTEHYDVKLENFKMNDQLVENVLNFYKEDYDYWKNLK